MTLEELKNNYREYCMQTGSPSSKGSIHNYVCWIGQALAGETPADKTVWHQRVCSLLDNGTLDRNTCSALRKLKEYLEIPTGGNTSWKRIIWENRKATGILPTMSPDDSNGGNLVRYSDNVRPEERVPGLLGFASGEYIEMIRHCACDLLRNLGIEIPNFRRFDLIPVIFSERTPSMQYEVNDDARKIMYELAQKLYGGQLPYEKAKEILELKSWVTPVLGMYFGDTEEPHIEIYYKNIVERTPERFFATVSMVLAHEYMHYVHHRFMGNSFHNDSFEACAVKEAIADFFAVWFLIDRPRLLLPGNDITTKPGIAQKRFEAWKDNLYRAWPYSFALFFSDYPFAKTVADYLQDRGFVLDKYKKVFLESRNGFSGAFDMLVR